MFFFIYDTNNKMVFLLMFLLKIFQSILFKIYTKIILLKFF